jgi:antitoxin MazE
MTKSTQIAKRGTALEAKIGEGDTVEGSVRDGEIVARPAYSLPELVDQITPENRHGETDWGKPSGREQW